MTEPKNDRTRTPNRATLLATSALAALSLACGASVSSDNADAAEAVDVEVTFRATESAVVVEAEAEAEGADASAATLSKARIRIRGNNGTVVEGALDPQPLIYVDGVRVDRGAAVDTDAVLAALDPSQIARVEVLKGPAAQELYGDEASNGVIQIFLNEEEDAEGVREALGSVLSGIGEGISRTGEGIKKAGEKIRKK